VRPAPHRLTCLLFVCLAWQCAGESRLQAQGGSRGMSPEDRKKYDELMKSAKDSYSLGILLTQAVAVLIGLGLLYAAWSSATKGFKITEKKTMTGPGAKVLAAVLALLGIGAIAAGIFYVPTLGP